MCLCVNGQKIKHKGDRVEVGNIYRISYGGTKLCYGRCWLPWKNNKRVQVE